MASQTVDGGDTAEVEETGGGTPTDEHHDWVASTFGFDPRSFAGSSDAASGTESAETAAPEPAPAAAAPASGGLLSALSDAADSAQSAVADAADTIADTAHSAAASAADAAESAADAANSAVVQAQSAAANAATGVEDAVEGAGAAAKATVADVVATATQDIKQGVTDVEDAVSDLAGPALAAPVLADASGLPAAAGLAAMPGGAEPQGSGVGAELSFEMKVPVTKADLQYFDAEGTVAYKVTYEPADSGEADVKTKLENGQGACEAALKTKFGHDVTLKGGGEVSGTKGKLSAELEIETSERAKTTFAFEAVDVDAKDAKIKFAELKWTDEYTLVSGTFDIPDLKVKYSGKVAVEVDFEPKWAKLAKSAAEKFGEDLATDVVVDAAFDLAIGTVAIAVIAACADAFVQLANLANLQAGLSDAYRSMNGGLLDGASGKDAAASDPIYTQFWNMGHQAFQQAAAKAVQQGLSMDDLDQEATDQANKAVKSWPQTAAAVDQIRWAFFRGWVAENHGYGTFEGDARDAVMKCFGVYDEPITGPHMSYWANASKLPHFLKD
jgi:hypothetical protein